MNLFYAEVPPLFRRDAWYGLIFRWYGVDAAGNIAIFETGEQPVPKAVFSSESAYRDVDVFFRSLPQITTAEISITAKRLRTASGNPVNPSIWLDEASKGLYYIDEIDTHNENEYLYGYYLTAIPDEKLNASDLPEKIKHLLSPYHFPVVFAGIEKIDVTKYFECD